MKLAVAVWNNRVAPVFDCAGAVLLLEAGGGTAAGQERLEIGVQDAGTRARVLRGRGVGELICGALSREAERALRGEGILVRAFVAGDVPDVLGAWLRGELDDEEFSLPGCRRGRRRRGAGGGRCRGKSNGPPW